MSVTTPEEVKRRYLSNEYTDDEINSEIDIVEAYIYDRYYLPKRTKFTLDNDYTRFYIYDTRVYEIVDLKQSVPSTVEPSGWLNIGSENYTFNSGTNYIDFNSQFVNENDGEIIRVRLIPQTHNLLATDMVRLNLISSMTVISGEDTVPPLISQLKSRIQNYKINLKPKRIAKSSDFSDYNLYDYISISQSNFR